MASERNPYEGDPRYEERFKVHTIRATGAVSLYGPEIDIVDTPEFQRLGGIKQLGTSYFVYRGAVHTRFEHSLGTLQKAEDIIQAVNRSPHRRGKVDARGRRLARLGALLHDLPHVPFGHTLEDEFGLLDRHDKNHERIEALLQNSRIGAILSEALPVEDYERLLVVLEAVEPSEEERRNARNDDELVVERLGEYAYIVDIVANTVCADVLDYIVRDLTACGMPVAIGDRFLDFFLITSRSQPEKGNRHRMALQLDKRGMPRPDVESEVIKLLTYRYELAERVFFHHAKNAASVMIGQAVQELELHRDDANFRRLSDDLLLAVLAKPDVGDALGLSLTDDADARKRAAAIGNLLAARRLYKLAFLGVYDDDASFKANDIWSKWGKEPGARAQLQGRLADRAEVEAGHVLVHLPQPKMMAKLARVRVNLEGDTITTFEEWEQRHSGRVQALNQAHARLWRVGVYLHPDDARDEAKIRLVMSAARDLFGIRSRYAQPEVDEPYLATVFDLFVTERGWPADRRETVIREASKLAATAEQPGNLQATVELIERAAVRAARVERVNEHQITLPTEED